MVQKGNSRPVIEKINLLKSLFEDQFYEIFQINSADNGSEFDSFVEIETDSKIRKGAMLFILDHTNLVISLSVKEITHLLGI